MPFQTRCLMVPVLRWAAHSPFMAHAAQALAQSSTGPDQLMLQFVDALCLILLGAVLVQLRNHFSPVRLFSWLAPFLLLWCVLCDYVARYESRNYTPYDVTTLLFFTLGLLLCLKNQSLLFLLLLAVATFNRETTIFLLPIWLVVNWQRNKLYIWATAAAGFAIWVVEKIEIRRLTSYRTSGLDFPLRSDLRTLALPHHWAQVASVAGFLVVPVIIFRYLVRDSRLKALWVGYLPYIAATVLMGWWQETRVFGELIPLFSITAAIQFEQYIRNWSQSSSASLAETSVPLAADLTQST